jgi:hypothetical protein
VAVGTHDNEIGAESGSLRQQKATHVFSAGRQAAYLHVRAVTRQVARDIRPRLFAVTGMTLMVDDQHFDRLGPHKQWQGVRHGPDGFAPGVPRHKDATDTGYRAARRKHDDRPAGA